MNAVFTEGIQPKTAAASVIPAKQSFQQSFTERQTTPTPFLILRVQDYLLHHTLCRRLERSLTPDPAATPPVTVPPSLAEHSGKCRDRLRKAPKELEDAATKLAPPPPPPAARPFNLPDLYKPILEEVGVDLINDPVLFDAIERGDDARTRQVPNTYCDPRGGATVF